MQSGGPTAVINSTLAGIIKIGADAVKSGAIDGVLGALNGIDGVISSRYTDLLQSTCNGNIDMLYSLSCTPAMALGSCRRPLPSDLNDPLYDTIIKSLVEADVKYTVIIGGNDSMDTVMKLSAAAYARSAALYFNGAVKTVDNDLNCTYFSPGYGSAAKYIGISMLEIIRDAEIYNVKSLTVVEVMGREAGWLGAAAALPHAFGNTAPHLVYLPERTFSFDGFVADVKREFETHNNVIAVVCEGIKTADGKYAAEGNMSGAVDAFGHAYLSGIGKVLENFAQKTISCKARSIELNVLQRSAAHAMSETDRSCAWRVGEDAALKTLECVGGLTAVIGSINPCVIKMADISEVANYIRCVPDDYINESGNMVTNSAIDYILPLIQGEVGVKYCNGLPKHFSLTV